MLFCVQLTTIFLTTGQRAEAEAAIIRPSTPPPPPPPTETAPAPVHTSTAPAPPPPEAAPAPAEQTDGADVEAVQESQTSEAAKAEDQAKPSANENAEDAEAVGVVLGKASNLVEAGLEDTELEDAEVYDQRPGAVPLEGRCYIT
jgi:hypothetical protein